MDDTQIEELVTAILDNGAVRYFDYWEFIVSCVLAFLTYFSIYGAVVSSRTQGRIALYNERYALFKEVESFFYHLEKAVDVNEQRNFSVTFISEFDCNRLKYLFDRKIYYQFLDVTESLYEQLEKVVVVKSENPRLSDKLRKKFKLFIVAKFDINETQLKVNLFDDIDYFLDIYREPKRFDLKYVFKKVELWKNQKSKKS